MKNIVTVLAITAFLGIVGVQTVSASFPNPGKGNGPVSHPEKGNNGKKPPIIPPTKSTQGSSLVQVSLSDWLR